MTSTCASDAWDSRRACSIVSKSAIRLPAIFMKAPRASARPVWLDQSDTCQTRVRPGIRLQSDSHAMTVVAPESVPRAVVVVRLGEIIGRPVEQPRHPRDDDLAHVGGARLLFRVRDVTVNRIPHLRVEAAGAGVVDFPASLAQVDPR